MLRQNQASVCWFISQSQIHSYPIFNPPHEICPPWVFLPSRILLLPLRCRRGDAWHLIFTGPCGMIQDLQDPWADHAIVWDELELLPGECRWTGFTTFTTFKR